MPEGDTIFRAATALRKALLGAKVTQFRSEKLALLTQPAIAGVGNVIKCEALFLARVDPFAPVGAVAPEALALLAGESHRLLVRNRAAGSRASRSFGPRFWAYGRAGKPCLRCGAQIRARRASRITYFCPSCQRSVASPLRPAGRSAPPQT